MPPRSKNLGAAPKRVPLNMRTTQEMREKVERAAAQSGLSLVQEVERRLEKSFRDEEVLIGGIGGPSAEPFVRPVVYFLDIMQRAGMDWMTNRDVAGALPGAIGIIAEAVSSGCLSVDRQS